MNRTDGEPQALRRELKRLLVGTNDLRRRTGQTLWHFHKTLVFWDRRGRAFLPTARTWFLSGAEVFAATGRMLSDLGPSKPDRALRRFVATVLEELARTLGRGDHMLHPFLRWLEGRFPALTEMMRRSDSKIYDSDLARDLAVMFGHSAREGREALCERLRGEAARLVAGSEAREGR